jgi:hypothetical protein
MGRRQTFTQAEVTRAIKAATAAGMAVARCEITPDGAIVISTEATAKVQADPLTEWRTRKDARGAKGAA